MNKKILCDVIFPIPSFSAYTYYIPNNISFKNTQLIGSRIIADFGYQKDKIGVVINLKEEIKDLVGLKPIKSILDITPLFDKEQIEIAKKLSNLYLYPLGMMMNIFFNIEKNVPFKQGVLVDDIKTNFAAEEVSKEFLKIINSYKKRILYIPSNMKEKFNFYKDLIVYSIVNGKKLLILFPSVEFISDFWNYLINSGRGEEGFFNTKVMKYAGEVDIKERFKIWYLFRNNQINVVLATKIGCFLPFNDLSYIVIDEPDSLGYRNPEVPAYNTIFIVEERAKNYDYKIIYCTFLPSIELMYKNKDNVIMSKVAVLKKNKIKVDIIKKGLKDIIIKNIYKFKQTIVIFPYRGYARFYVCVLCKKPISSKIVEKEKKFLCPYCKSNYYKKYGTGIKKFVESIRNIDKNFNVEYIDYDIKEKNIEEIINKFNNGKIDVLVSTFVIMDYIYRLKFNNVQSVYFTSLDGLLYKPDYTTYERVYKIIKMVQIMLASCDVENPEILVEIITKDKQNEVLLKDYNSFYRSELKLRKELAYPPFSYVVKVGFKAKNQVYLQNVHKELINCLASVSNIEVFDYDEVDKINKQKEYKSGVLLKIVEKKDETLCELINLLKQTIEKNPKIKIYIEYNPIFW